MYRLTGKPARHGHREIRYRYGWTGLGVYASDMRAEHTGITRIHREE